MKRFLEKSSFSTLTYVLESRSYAKRVLWLAVVTAAVAAFVYTTADRFQTLLSKPTSTTISLKRETELSFPAVTLCSRAVLNTTRVQSPGYLEHYLGRMYTEA